eukprot:3302932-Amphidinium_carterae.1
MGGVASTSGSGTLWSKYEAASCLSNELLAMDDTRIPALTQACMQATTRMITTIAIQTITGHNTVEQIEQIKITDEQNQFATLKLR